MNRLRVERLEDRLTPTGGLDPLFGGDGKLTADLGGTDVARAVAVQPDGRILAVGYSNGASLYDFAITRFTADGKLDPTFSGDGKTTVHFGVSPASGTDIANAVAVQPDGRIFVAGYSNLNGGVGGGYDFAVARLLANGALDATFGAGGKVTVNLGGDDTAAGIAVQPDGNVVVVGSWDPGASDFAAIRLTASGGLDPTFGGGAFGAGSGKSNVPFAGGAENSAATSVVVQPGGRILVGGWTDTGVAGKMDFAVARLGATGMLDGSFDGDGRASYDLGGLDRAAGLALQPDGKVVVAGVISGATSDGFAARLTSNGELDPTFSTDGWQPVTWGGVNDHVTGVALQGDGDLVLSGYANFGNAAAPYDAAVVRLTSTGVYDAAFTGDGKATIDFGGNDAAYGVALQPDGNVVVAGTTGGDLALARLVANPAAVVANFGNETWRWTSDQGWKKLRNEAALELDMADDGTVFAVYPAGVWRFNEAGFGQNTTPGVPERVEVTDGGVAYGDFGGAGLFRYTPGGSWVQVTSSNPTRIETSDDGSCFAQFGNNLFRIPLSGLSQFLTANPATSFTAADGGALYGVFGNGVWRWQNGNWTGVTGAVPQNYAVTDSGLFYGDFGADGGPDGVWQWSPYTGAWTGLTGADPSNMSVTPDGSLYGTFLPGSGAAGLWRWDGTTRTWSQPHFQNPVAGAAGVDGSCFADFGAFAPGLWRYAPGVGWQLLSPGTPSLITARR